ncbi:unnamed protein product [Rhizoctonia solani]|uniref:Uncharacterized protein n=1 Tax=Rhizoctonia solani TaxID=456999 RepID=A0A8H3GCX2_9AGAM|nr:unnamed protein product [Rhizoctonia solani]
MRRSTWSQDIPPGYPWCLAVPPPTSRTEPERSQASVQPQSDSSDAFTPADPNLYNSDQWIDLSHENGPQHESFATSASYPNDGRIVGYDGRTFNNQTTASYNIEYPFSIDTNQPQHESQEFSGTRNQIPSSAPSYISAGVRSIEGSLDDAGQYDGYCNAQCASGADPVAPQGYFQVQGYEQNSHEGSNTATCELFIRSPLQSPCAAGLRVVAIPAHTPKTAYATATSSVTAPITSGVYSPQYGASRHGAPSASPSVSVSPWPSDSIQSVEPTSVSNFHGQISTVDIYRQEPIHMTGQQHAQSSAQTWSPDSLEHGRGQVAPVANHKPQSNAPVPYTSARPNFMPGYYSESLYHPNHQRRHQVPPASSFQEESTAHTQPAAAVQPGDSGLAEYASNSDQYCWDSANYPLQCQPASAIGSSTATQLISSLQSGPVHKATAGTSSYVPSSEPAQPSYSAPMLSTQVAGTLLPPNLSFLKDFLPKSGDEAFTHSRWNGPLPKLGLSAYSRGSHTVTLPHTRTPAYRQERNSWNTPPSGTSIPAPTPGPSTSVYTASQSTAPPSVPSSSSGNSSWRRASSGTRSTTAAAPKIRKKRTVTDSTEVDTRGNSASYYGPSDPKGKRARRG